MTSSTPLQNRVGDLVGDPVATIKPTATMLDAADVLASEGLGLLVVVDGGGVRGVLSERDVITAIAERVDLEVARVRDHASTDLVQVEEDATVFEAATEMAAAEIRHLAVARHGVVTGIVSVREVINALIAEHDQAR